ncbi:hypothetical protein VCHA40P238_230030 [Vibrio chagasii]|nr:hypothetical protein VCHA40P238_230030 [Vibrio chagasii]
MLIWLTRLAKDKPCLVELTLFSGLASPPFWSYQGEKAGLIEFGFLIQHLTIFQAYSLS